jgi:hypothetical protein
MKKLVKQLLASIFVVGLLAAVPQGSVYAANGFKACDANNTSPVCADADSTKVNSLIQTIINTLLFVLGAIAIIMIVIGGIRYTTSNGDSSSIKGAKDTILYAVVGLVVAILAYAIVNFVLSYF